MTLCIATGRKMTVAATGATAGAIILFSFIFALLPAMGMGDYKYSGEGFCYFDWLDTAQIVLLELVTIPSMLATLVFMSMALNAGPHWLPGSLGVGYNRWMVVMVLSYVAAWVLWIPAGVIGLTSDSMDDFPSGMMISGAVLGHAQALINPLLYGLLWRSWMRSSPASCKESGTEVHWKLQENDKGSGV